jgi:hypothetical protein
MKFSGNFFGKRGVLVFMSMNLRDTIKRILKEDLGNTRLDNQKRLIERLLEINSYEGVCSYVVTEDKIDDMVGAVIIKFSEEWYRSNDETRELKRKLELIQTTKDDISKLISKFLGIKNLYVGSVLTNCN